MIHAPSPLVRGLHRRGGFTLIELMITVAIIAIVASIAYPSYQSHVIRSRRGSAAGCLLELAQYMERVYTTNLVYNSNGGVALTALPATQCTVELTGIYAFSFDIGQPKAAAFVIVAAPQGMQAAKDTACGTLSTDQTGAKGRTGSAAIAECWRR